MGTCTDLKDARMRLADALSKVVKIKGQIQYRADSDLYERMKIDNKNPEYDDRWVVISNGQVIGISIDIEKLLTELYRKYGEDAHLIVGNSTGGFIYTENPSPAILQQRQERLESDRQYLEGFSPVAYRGQWVAVKDGKVVISDGDPLNFFERLLAMFPKTRRRYVAFKQFPA